MGKGCTEKLDPEFIWWVLWEGRTRERGKGNGSKKPERAALDL